jgi:hypothetical protein
VLTTRISKRLLGALPGRRPRVAVGENLLDIDRLISPLRYDVLVRQRYLEFLARNLDLFHRDFDAFVDLARREPYHAWFCAVAIHRIRPGTAPEELDGGFRERLRKTTRLYLGMSERGFDPQFPITVRTAGPVATTTTGKIVTGRLFPSDGCHRLAMLRHTGHRSLLPQWYRLRSDGDWQPPDNTGTLLAALGISRAEYFEFLSLGYADSIFHDEDALLAHVPSAAQVDELRRIIAIDRPALEAQADQAQHSPTSVLRQGPGPG